MCTYLIVIYDRGVEWCVPILRLKIDVTTCCNELFHDGRIPVNDRDVEWYAPMHVLVVDEGLSDLCRQQRANLRCVTITRDFAKLLPRHVFPIP